MNGDEIAIGATAAVVLVVTGISSLFCSCSKDDNSINTDKNALEPCHVYVLIGHNTKIQEIISKKSSMDKTNIQVFSVACVIRSQGDSDINAFLRNAGFQDTKYEKIGPLPPYVTNIDKVNIKGAKELLRHAHASYTAINGDVFEAVKIKNDKDWNKYYETMFQIYASAFEAAKDIYKKGNCKDGVDVTFRILDAKDSNGLFESLDDYMDKVERGRDLSTQSEKIFSKDSSHDLIYSADKKEATAKRIK